MIHRFFRYYTEALLTFTILKALPASNGVNPGQPKLSLALSAGLATIDTKEIIKTPRVKNFLEWRVSGSRTKPRQTWRSEDAPENFLLLENSPLLREFEE